MAPNVPVQKAKRPVVATKMPCVPAVAEPTEHVHRHHHKSAAAKRRRHTANVNQDQRKSENLMIPRRPLKRMIHDAINHVRPNDGTRIRSDALDLLHHATEAHLKSIFQKLNVIATSHQNKTVLARHFTTLIQLRECGVDYPVQK
jgi:histone H3/H4